MADPATALPDRRIDWPIFAILFVLIAAAFVLRALLAANKTPLLADTDDAMRLVMVRDFLDGQNWYDLIQHRLDVPFGASIHWSRLVDLCIATLLVVFHPLAGPSTETIVAYIWPLLLLLGLLLLSARLSLRLGGREALLGALALPAFSPALVPEFSPGRLDHTSIEILLLLALVWCSVEAIKRPRFAIGAGLAAATALAIGIEGLPTVAMAIVVFGVLWAVKPQRVDAMLGFGFSFAAFMLVHQAIALPPERWFAPMCDAISIVYTAAAVGTGVVFAILALLPLGQSSPLSRLVVGAALGALLLAVLLVLFPDCLHGPYAVVSPWLTANWLNRITEARPLLESIGAIPAFSLAVAVPPILALIVTIIRVVRQPDDRGEWLIYGAFLLATVLVMLIEIRGSRLAAPLAIPAGAWLIAAARARYLGGAKPWGAAGMLASWISFAGLALFVIIGFVITPFQGRAVAAVGQAQADQAQCLMPKSFAALAAMPTQRIMAPIDLGSHILLNTPHSVVAAPYHRAQRGLLDAFHFFNQPIGEARDILRNRAITLVVICPAMPELGGLPDSAENSFVKLFAGNRLPDWLKDVSAPGAALKIYAVQP